MSNSIKILALAACLSAASHGFSQTDVAASVYGAFTESTNGNGTTQSSSTAAGGLIELHHQARPWLGVEATYAFNRANQTYTGSTVSCGVVCGDTSTTIYTSVPANAHEITGDWVGSFRLLNLRPFVLAGGGVLLQVPAGSQSVGGTTTVPTQTKATGVVVYGAGLDYALMPHVGLRAQYRGNIHKANQLATAFSSTENFVHTAEPMIGVYFRF